MRRPSGGLGRGAGGGHGYTAAGKAGGEGDAEIANSVGVDAVGDFAPMLFTDHEVGGGEGLEVTRDSRLREVEEFDDLVDSPGLALEHEEDLKPGGVGESPEGRGEDSVVCVFHTCIYTHICIDWFRVFWAGRSFFAWGSHQERG